MGDLSLYYCLLINSYFSQFIDLMTRIPTFGLVEELYSRVDKDTLIYNLLLELLKERKGTSWTPDPSDPLKEISLFEVSLASDKH